MLFQILSTRTWKAAAKMNTFNVPRLTMTFVLLSIVLYSPTITGIGIKPLWDRSEINSSCVIDDSAAAQDVYTLQNSAFRTCSLQVTAANGYHVRIEVSNEHSEQHLLYIEKLGNVLTCPNQFLKLEPSTEQETCSTTVMHERLQINLQGIGRVTVSEVLESIIQCPEFDVNGTLVLKKGQSSVCSNIKGYNNYTTCNLELGGLLNSTGFCKLQFSQDCVPTISKGEISGSCFDNQLLRFPDELTELDLSNNSFDAISSNAFGYLDNLQILYLNKTRLSKFTPRMFDSLHNLKFLFLNSSQFTDSLRDDLFQNLVTLTHLYLSDNKLSSVPITLVSYLKNLEVLFLDKNELVSLNSDFFSGLNNLKELDLAENNFTTLPADLFQGLDSLQILRIDRNQLSKVDSVLFRDLTNLRTLNLNHNTLSGLPVDLFRELRNLTELTLNHNNFTALDNDIFQDLENLTNLRLNNNSLSDLSTGLFHGLKNLQNLTLSVNQLVQLDSDLLKGLENLLSLKLDQNLLTSIPVDIFRDLMNLYELTLNNNQLSSLPVGLFQGLESLNNLIINNNSLTEVPVGLFQDLRSLQKLHLHYNEIDTIYNRSFTGLTNITNINLNGNLLVTLPDGVFHELGTLDTLSLRANEINSLDVDIFQGLDNLTILRLTNNSLSEIPLGIFRHLRNLIALELRGNILTTLDVNIFHDVPKLERLFLHHNDFENLPAGIFDILVNLKLLRLNENQFHKFDSDLFKTLVNLTFLDLSANRFEDIPQTEVLPYLEIFGAAQNPLTNVDSGSFSGLTNSTRLLVSQHEVCECYAPEDSECIAEDDRSPYLTCKRLLSDRILVGFIWIIGLNALAGNVFVLIWKRKHGQTTSVQSILLSNLAVSDFLMGVYMIMIACADIYFGEHFPMQSEKWRSGTTCKIAGTLAIVSSEASVFFVTLISLDRLISIKYPDSGRWNQKKATLIIVLVTWLVSFALGFIPSALAGRNFKFYDNSHVCIGLPLSLLEIFTKHHFEPINWEKVSFWLASSYSKSHGFEVGLYYSTGLFLGLNLVCFLLVFVCYIEIVRILKMSFKRAGGGFMKEEIRMTLKVSAIVATDFCCWFPIIILGILVQARTITLPPDTYAWLVTCVLPINSAINPYLYTIAEVISQYRKQKKEGSEEEENANSVTQQMNNILNPLK